MRKTPFIEGEYYHIYSRTMLNDPMFRNPENANRLKLSLMASNSTRSSEAFEYIRNLKRRKFFKMSNFLKIINRGEKIVDVVCYSIMPDHYHLILREIKEDGISNFVRKVNISVSKYINIRNDRKGPIFESRFKSIHIDSNDYLLHLSLYIHLNPLDFLIGKTWRKHELKNWSEAKKKLINYELSSVGFYLGENKRDLIVSGTDIVLGQFDDKKEYESFLKNWSEDDINTISELSLEN